MLKEKTNLVRDNSKILVNFIYIILLAVFTYAFVPTQVDTDIFFQLNHGKYILNNSFPTIEPFTMHNNLSFTIQKWATCVLYYVIYNYFEYAGLIWIVRICTTLYLISIFLFLRKKTNNELTSLVITILSSIVFIFLYSSTRPQIFSYIFIVWTFAILDQYISNSNKRNRNYVLVGLPIISILWMQFHSTQWIFMFAIYLCFLVNKEILKSSKKWIIMSSGLLSFLSGIINPYGFTSIKYMFKALKDTSHLSMIAECQPTNAIALILVTCIPLLILICQCITKDDIIPIKTIPIQYIWFLLGTLIMSCMALRNLSYYIIALTLFLGILFQNINLNKIFSNKNLKLLAIIFLIAGILFGHSQKISTNNSFKSSYDLVDEFAKIIDPDTTDNKNVYCHFNDGAYLEWRGYKAFQDARSEVFTKTINNKVDITQDALDMYLGNITIKDLQKKYKFDYYFVPQNSYEARDLQYEGKEILLENEDYIIFKD